MSKTNMPIKMKAVIKVEKYRDGTTQEQIDNKEVEPEEVVYSEDQFTK